MTSPAFPVNADEMVVVKVFVSAVQGVLTPLGVAARISPRSIGITSLAGFTYRRERGLGGSFISAEDIERAQARRLGDLVRPLNGVRMAGTAPTDTITFLRGDDLPRCRPLYYIDGKPVTANVEEAINAIAMERIFGVEIYTAAGDVPSVFADIGPECGIIAIWMKR